LQVTVVGVTEKPIEPVFEADTKLKGFHLQSYVYKSAEEKSVSLKLVCLFPNTKRWANVALPKRGALVSVTGEVIGVHYETKCFAVLIQNFNFINPAGTEAATRSSQQHASQDSQQGGTPASRWARKRPADSPLTGLSPVKREPSSSAIQVPTTPTSTQMQHPQSSPIAAAPATPTPSSSNKGKGPEVISLEEDAAPPSTQRTRGRWTKPVTVMSDPSSVPTASASGSGGKKRGGRGGGSNKPVKGKMSVLVESDETEEEDSVDEL